MSLGAILNRYIGERKFNRGAIMPRGYAEIVITINPIGIEKAEVIAIEGDSDSEMMGVEMYGQLAVAIHRWSKEAKQILCSHWDNVRAKAETSN